MKKKRRRYELKPEIERYHPNYLVGLTPEQVEERKKQGKVNVSPKGSSKTVLDIILKNVFTFFNAMYATIFVLLLIADATIMNFTFIGLVVINTMIGIFQEIRSKRKIDQLSLLSAPTATVVRNEGKQEIRIEEVVLDDIIYLSTGKQIITDAILVHGEVEVNESQLTGEAIPIRKMQGDTLYSGSYVVSGNCYAKVERVGEENKIEQYASQARKHVKPRSEILRSLGYLLRFVSIIIIPCAIILFAKAEGINLRDIKSIIPALKASTTYQTSIVTTSAALIGMIPAGLFLLTTVALAVGVMRLARQQTLVQELYCIETLARVDVLCLDKTGTITDGTMTVTRYIEYNRRSEYNVEDIISSMNTALQETNSTSKALETYFGFGKKMTPVEIFPFSSDTKYSAVTFEKEGTFILGAPEFVLKNNYERVADDVNEYANQGLRVLALAHSQLPLKNGVIQRVPRIVALILIEDQIRREAYDTIKFFKDNGVQVKVISGDNPVTVSEVAKRVGIENAEDYISLDGLTDEEVAQVANGYTVFGRVKPEQKKIIVQALKANKHTVAMTGDGVNDILALKEADCSIAMASGSDAVRNVAQLVLLDSNFSSMPQVVSEGRRVINNIQRTAMLYLVKTLFTFFMAILTISNFFKFFSPGGNGGYPLESSQMLMIEFFVIGIPTFFLALQPNKNIVRGKFLFNVIRSALPSSLTIAIEVALAYLVAKMFGFTDMQVVTIVVITATATYLMILFVACKPFTAMKVILFSLMSICCLTIIICSSIDVKIGHFSFREQFKLVPLYETVYRPLENPHIVEEENGDLIWYVGDIRTGIASINENPVDENDREIPDFYLNEDAFWVIEGQKTTIKAKVEHKISANGLLLSICLTLSSSIIIYVANYLVDWFMKRPLDKIKELSQQANQFVK